MHQERAADSQKRMHEDGRRTTASERARRDRHRDAQSRPAHQSALERLQRTQGNQAVQRLVNERNAFRAPGNAEFAVRPTTPPLLLGDPNSRYEREADAVASRLVTPQTPSSTPPQVSRTPRGRPSNEEGGAVAPPIVSDVLAGSGAALPTDLRTGMESVVGGDFSRVSIHTGPRAAASAQSVDARAYTVGSDIVFNRGEYAPSTLTGQQVLAHELTHVVQHGSDVTRLQRLDFGALLETGKGLFQGGEQAIQGISMLMSGDLQGGASQLLQGGGQLLVQGVQGASQLQEAYQEGEALAGEVQQFMAVRKEVQAQAAAATKQMQAETRRAVAGVQATEDPLALVESTVDQIQSLAGGFLDSDYEANLTELVDMVLEQTGDEDLSELTGIPGADTILEAAAGVVQGCLGPQRRVVMRAARSIATVVKTAASSSPDVDIGSLESLYTGSLGDIAGQIRDVAGTVQRELSDQGLDAAAELVGEGAAIADTVATLAPPPLAQLQEEAKKQALTAGAAGNPESVAAVGQQLSDAGASMDDSE